MNIFGGNDNKVTLYLFQFFEVNEKQNFKSKIDMICFCLNALLRVS